MKKLLGLAVVVAASVALSGCNRVDGDKYADELNKVVVAKINGGGVTILDLASEEWMKERGREALKNMGYQDPDKAMITDSEKKKFDAKIETYQKQWIELVSRPK